MKYSAKVEVKFKEGLFDPEGETTKKSLQGLRFPVEDAKLSKVFNIKLDAKTKDEAYSMVEEMCKKLLANPNKDDYKIIIEEIQ
ncbi:MAG: phosphoribosylformylglycinamidine synthase subunit PurS [Candidatus Aenigmarchaeota archaeon]|nr:phosphoribosylformylglycinamidine synthase subunit PurS [Candidatus Aenigmarchaeota archaeon]